MRRRAAILHTAVSLAVLVGCRGESSTTSQTPGSGRIVRVVDGDTVVVDFGRSDETVRLIGIDTPETVKPESPVECFGPEASAFTKSLLPEGTEVVVERDVEARDDYGRLLGYLTRRVDGVFVNLEIVEQGYARPLRFEPNTTHAALFADAARRAERSGAGLWSACGR